MKTLSFDNMVFSRNSLAWCPITGKRVPIDAPRVVSNQILAPLGGPIIYYKFDVSQGFMDYGEASCYTRVGTTTDHFDDALDALEAAIPGIDREVLGTSEDGRDIEKFQLGADDKETFAITCVVHGNEVDGLLGDLKAFEIICTHPDFAQLRNDYTLVLFPCCNPDGYYEGTRNLTKLGPHPSGVDKTINLNRVWPWFWTEYVPTSDESKGATPMDCDEAQVLYTWRTTGNGGSPIKIKFLMDQHSTAGDGARYQSRDKCFRDIEEGDLETLWADWNIYRLQKATQAVRVQNDSMPDLWVNYFRSRWKPHWHSWNSTRPASDNGGIPPIVMVNEYNKVISIAVDDDKETYQSACNYTLDYIISCARMIQGDMTEYKDAVLIEHETATNLAQNSQFEQWQERNDSGDPVDYRPGYWTPSRTIMESSTHEDRHMQYQGRPIKLAADLVYTVPDPYILGPEDYHDLKLNYTEDTLYMLAPNSTHTTFGVLSCVMPDEPALALSSYGNTAIYTCTSSQQGRLVKAIEDEIYFVLLDNSDKVSLVSLIDAGVGFADTVITEFGEPRVDAATCGYLDTLYIIGGKDAGDAASAKVLLATTAAIAEVGSDLLDTADSGFSAIYCDGGTLDTNLIAVGGVATPSDPTKLKVVVIDKSAPSSTEYLVDVTDTTLPIRLVKCGLFWEADVDKLWIYGGNNPDDSSVHGGVWSLTWNGSGFDVADEEVIGGFDDDGDPEDVSGEEVWNNQWTNWRFGHYIDVDTGVIVPVLLGGVTIDPVTGLPDAGPYKSMYCHYVSDNVIAQPQDYTFGYVRYNTALSIGANDYGCTSWSYKVPTTSSETACYVRINNAPGTAGILTTRRARTYYLHPPQWWWRESASIDFTTARPDYTEVEWRAYLRYYRDDQDLYIDAPMITAGSLWPSSWSPYGMTRAVESGCWTNSIDPRWCRVTLNWLPQSCYLAMKEDTRLVRIGESTDNYRLELWAIVDSKEEREYYKGMTKGIAEPLLELRSYSDPTTYTSCSLPVYWGGYVKDVSHSRFDSPLVLTIWQHAEYGFGLIVKNGYAEGWTRNVTKPVVANWASDYSLFLLGGGYWAAPELYTTDRVFINKYIEESNYTGALLMGDRDPTYGQISYLGLYRYTETFTRSNSTNLGSYWNIIGQTGNGWDIYSNEARCGTVGWEMWVAYPYLRDTIISATFRIHQNTSIFGLFQRVNWSSAMARSVYGYLGSLSIDGAGNPSLIIETVTDNVKATIATKAVSYSLDTSDILSFESNGSTLTLKLKDSGGVLIDSVSIVDTTYISPGALGICGETPSNTDYIYIEDIEASPYSAKIRITE